MYSQAFERWTASWTSYQGDVWTMERREGDCASRHPGDKPILQEDLLGSTGKEGLNPTKGLVIHPVEV